MNLDASKALAAVVLVVVGVGVVWLWKRGPGGASEDAAKAVAKVVAGAATGVVKGVAEGVAGIPDTDPVLCKQAIAAGDMWNASKYCPAGEFLAAGGSAFYQWFRPNQRS